MRIAVLHGREIEWQHRQRQKSWTGNRCDGTGQGLPLLEVVSRVSERRRASFTFAYEIRNEARELVATGFTRHACWNPATSKMIPLPDWLKEIMPDADLDPTDR